MLDCCRDASTTNGAERVYELRPLQMFMWKNLKVNWVGKRRKLEEMRGVIAIMMMTTRSYGCGRWRSNAVSCDREIPFPSRDWQRQTIDTHNDLFSLSSWVLSLRELFPGRAAENKGLCVWADVTVMLRSSELTSKYGKFFHPVPSYLSRIRLCCRGNWETLKQHKERYKWAVKRGKPQRPSPLNLVRRGWITHALPPRGSGLFRAQKGCRESQISRISAGLMEADMDLLFQWVCNAVTMRSAEMEAFALLAVLK